MYQPIHADSLRGAFLVLLAAVLYHLSSPGAVYPLLAIICLVPLGLALQSVSRLRGFVYAFSFGFLCWLAIAQGFATGIKQYLTLDSWQAGLYVVLLCSYQALPYGLFGLVYSSRVCSGGRYGALRSAACMTLILYLFPVPLPVFQVHSLYIFPILIQLLDIGGEPLLLFLFSLFNWLLVDLMLCLKHRVRTLQVSVSLLMLCIVVLGYGQFRLDGQLEKQESIDMEGGMRIVAIQPNVPLPGTLSDHKEEKEHALRALKEMTQKALATDWELSLVVWPEAPIHMSLEPGSDDWAQFEALSRQQAVPLMINGSRIEPDSGREYNASALLDNGERLAEYRKQILFPFAEYIPGEEQLLFLRTLIPNASNNLAGNEQQLFPLGEDQYVVPVICYEVLFPEHLQRFAAQGAELFINVSNDAWFGNSIVAEFLVAAGVFRAVENRLPLIRNSNSGDSLLVRASGEIVAASRTPTFQRHVSIHQLDPPADRSLYSVLGNLFLYLLLTWATVEALGRPLLAIVRARREAM